MLKTTFVAFILFLGCLVIIPVRGFSTVPDIDVSPFGRSISGQGWLGVQWAEIRRVVRLEVVFPEAYGPLPRGDAMLVEYWHRHWDGTAIREYKGQDTGGVGWSKMDDWFNGEWKVADTNLVIEGRTAQITFAASNETEFPDLERVGVVCRPTLKVRLRFLGVKPSGVTIRTFTDSTWRESDVVMRFEGRAQCDDPIQVYNGRLLQKRAVSKASECLLQAKVIYALNDEGIESDRTIVTIRSPSNPFSFAVDEVESGSRVYIKDFGVLVTRARDATTIAEHRRILDEIRTRSVYDRVSDEPEQTLGGAWHDMPIKRPYYFILGQEGGRQRFLLKPNGDLWVGHPVQANDEKPDGSRFTRQPSGKDTGQLLWPDGMSYRFGLPRSSFAERFLADGYLPIVTTRWIEEDVVYEEEAFTTLLAETLNIDRPMEADDATVLLMKVRIVNLSPKQQQAQLTFSTVLEPRYFPDREPPTEVSEVLRVSGDQMFGSFNNESVLRYLIDARDKGHLGSSSSGVTYSLTLDPHGEHTLYIKLPFVTLTEARQIEQLRAVDIEERRENVYHYWRTRVEEGTQIKTPEPWLNEFYKAHVTHLLINNERELGSDRYAARVGSFRYGVFGNESVMMISDLDRRGYSEEAERSLELLLHHQGSRDLPGQFSTKEGVLYGAGGYEGAGYNQHHGWILWGLAEHYWYTRDEAWMTRVAPALVKGCRWVLEERKATMEDGGAGKVSPVHGLLPAGALEDVKDFWYWLSTNAFTWWGLENAAAALDDFGHPDGEQLVAAAEDYRQDILEVFREAMIRSPVVRLRDGTYVPYFPSRALARGRSLGWLRETLEGAIVLPVTRLLDPTSREAGWILKDYEDNLYISERYGYSIPSFERFWFSRGGFSMQPNLLHGPLPYLFRDQIKHFVRAYFNGFASAYDPTLRMLCEHPLPELGYQMGDHFKASDEAQSAYWLRLMFVTEGREDLHLGRGIPRYWLRDGETIGIQNASTRFGKLSYEIVSRTLEEKKIAMFLDPPTRNTPRQIIVRFRHPEGEPIRRVKLNGKAWEDFDGLKGDIRLPMNTTRRVEISAEY